MVPATPKIRYWLLLSIALLFVYFRSYNVSVEKRERPRQTALRREELEIPRLVTHRNPRISIIESKGCHDEVTFSFLQTLEKIGLTEVDVFLKDQRFGINEFYTSFSPERFKFQSISAFTPGYILKKTPDLVLSITSEYDVVAQEIKPALEELYRSTSSTLLAVAHHALEWHNHDRQGAIQPFIDSNRFRMITISPHVSNYMRTKLMPKWNYNQGTHFKTSTFVPVFDVPSASFNTSFFINTMKNYNPFRAILQGDLVVKRAPNRDWRGTFNALRDVLTDQRDTERSIELHMAGNGDLPPVPEQVAANVFFHVGLPYLDFYSALASSEVMVPAFGSQNYFQDKASSSVPASLIANVPLVATQQLLDTYTFLTRDEMFLVRPGETEIEAVKRLSGIMPSTLRRVKKRLAIKKERLMLDAQSKLEGWIEDAMVRSWYNATHQFTTL